MTKLVGPRKGRAMEKVKKEVEVPKELDEVCQALVNIAKTCKEAMKDGFQVGSDLPVILMAAVAELPKAMAGMEKVSGEFELDKAGSIKAGVLMAADLVALF